MQQLPLKIPRATSIRERCIFNTLIQLCQSTWLRTHQWFVLTLPSKVPLPQTMSGLSPLTLITHLWSTNWIPKPQRLTRWHTRVTARLPVDLERCDLDYEVLRGRGGVDKQLSGTLGGGVSFWKIQSRVRRNHTLQLEKGLTSMILCKPFIHDICVALFSTSPRPANIHA